MALAVLMVAAPACAGSSTDSGSPPSSSAAATGPTHEAFVAQAEPLCMHLQHGLGSFEEPMSFPAIPKEFGDAAAKYSGLVQEPVDSLGELTPPAEIASQWDEFMTEMQRSLYKAELTGQLVSDGNEDTDALWQAWTDNKTSRARAMEVADEMGLEACTQLESHMDMEM